MKKAIEYYDKGYNCGEAILKAVNKRKNIDIPVCIGSALGGGMCVGSVCGAVASGTVTIGYLKGRKETTQKNDARVETKEFMKKIKDQYGTNICIELKRKGVSCEEIINYVDHYLEDMKHD